MTRARRTKLRYRRVDTSTLAGLRTAERLLANDWIIWRGWGVGLFSIWFCKRSAS